MFPMCWTYKLQGDPSQMSQQHLNQPIEKDIQNQSQRHIGAFHQATIFETISQTQGTY